MTNLSFKPNLHSGVPDKYARMRMCPSTSALSTVPTIKKDEFSQETGRSVDRTFGTHAEIDCLHNIHKCLVLLILHVGSPPARSPSRLCCNLRRFFLHACPEMSVCYLDRVRRAYHGSCRRHNTLRCNVGLQSINLAVLGIPEVVDLCINLVQ